MRRSGAAMARFGRVSAALVGLAVACGRPAPRFADERANPLVLPKAQGEAFREHAPAAGPEIVYTPPELHETKLANGMRVLVADMGGTTLSFRLLTKGTAAFPGQPGAIEVMTRVLLDGTTTRDVQTLRRELEKAFAERWYVTTPDFVAIDMTLPVGHTHKSGGARAAAASASADVTTCIEILGDAAQRPALGADTVSFNTAPVLESASTWRDSSSRLASVTLARLLYGADHPYALTPAVDLEKPQKPGRAEIERLYTALFDPKATTLVIAGPVDDALLAVVRRVFDGWQGKPHAAIAEVPVPTPAPSARVSVIDRPGATQAQIVFGALGPERASPDWPAWLMLHQVLGANPASRLTRTLRDKSLATWGGRTQLDNYHRASAFYWESSVPRDRTAEVLAEVDRQFADVRAHGIPAPELDAAKNLYVRTMPLWFETTLSAARTLSAVAFFDLPLDAIAGLQAATRALDSDRLRSVAASYLARDRLHAVIVGDWASLKASILGLGWGPIEIRDANGKVLRTESP